MESRSPNLYNPPTEPQRPFEADYPHGAHADEAGRLLHDIEGRPLTADYVVGRTHVGRGDTGIPTDAYDALSTATTGRSPQAWPQSQLGRDVGRLNLDRRSGRPDEIFVSKSLTPIQAERVVAHEISHAIDLLAGRIPTASLKTELRRLYNTLNNPNRSRDGVEAASWGPRFTPQAHGYSGGAVDRELMAEAIRGYMADPNYVKTVAPKTAKAIRKAVNPNPGINKILQFNSLAGMLGLGLGELGRQSDDASPNDE